MLGDTPASRAHLDAAMATAKSARDWGVIGDGLRKLAAHRRAAVAYENGLVIDPDNPAILNNLAVTRLEEDRLEEAEALYRRLIKTLPVGSSATDRAQFSQASLLELLNRTEEAAQVCDDLLSRYPEDLALLTLNGRLLRRAGNLDAAEAALRKALSTSGQTVLGPPGKARLQQAAVWTELGQVLDRLDQPDTAIDAFSKANSLHRDEDGGRHNAKRFMAYAAACRSWFNTQRISEFAIQQIGVDQGARPIFFVGFPRSGTTLAEQVLAAHPRLATTGEHSPLEAVKADWTALTGLPLSLPDCLADLSAEAINACRARFLAAAEAVTGGLSGRRVVDKLPLNLVDIGLINLLFPDARVIVALRDPRDVVLSCFMQDFRINDAMAAFLNRADTVALYCEVMSLWQHYRAVVTLPWIEYRYEDLIEDFAGTARRLVTFTGETWDPAILQYREQIAGRSISTPSYAAVAAPLHSRAKGRWRRYQAWLAPDAAALEPFIEEFGYSI